MTKNRLVAFSLLLTMFAMPVSANVTLDDITTPKDLFFRLGTTDIPENQIDITVKEEVKPQFAKEDKYYSEGLTYADLSIKKMALEVSKSVEVDYNEMMEDLSLLWQGAATKSDTIKFAIYKLSNPDKDKPDSFITDQGVDQGVYRAPEFQISAKPDGKVVKTPFQGADG